tara:strand:+ start:974 stop:1135 length:162 start_codon:yes stop_codon:yes gene_type:complete
MARVLVKFNFEVPFDVINDNQEELHEDVIYWFQNIRPDNLPLYEVSNKPRDEE